jgi:hypothetical protein
MNRNTTAKKQPPETDEGHRKVATIDYSVPTPKGGEAWHQMDVHINEGFTAAVREAMQPMIEEEKRKAEAALELLAQLFDAILIINWNAHSARIEMTIDGKTQKLGDYAIIRTTKAHELTGQYRAMKKIMEPPQKKDNEDET